MQPPEILGDIGTGMAPILPVLFDAAVKGAVLLAVAGLIALSLRKRSAAARHAVWAAALSAHLMLPLLGYLLPEWNVPLVKARWLQEASSAAAPTTVTSGVSGERRRVDATASPTPTLTTSSLPASGSPSSLAAVDSRQETRPSGVPAGTIMIALWLVGAALVLIRLAVGTVGVARLARGGARVDDGGWLSLAQGLANRLGIRRPLTLLTGERLGIPVTWGIVYPVVFLPSDADAWPEERRRYVLVHEIAHVKRLDALTQLVAQVTVAFFWFDPLVWLAAHRMRVEREHACDDYVLSYGTKPSLYAHDLLDMVRSLGEPGRRSARPAFAALAMARRSEFEGRMLAILDPNQDRQTLTRRGALMYAAAIFAFAVPLALAPGKVIASSNSTELRTGDGAALRAAIITAPSESQTKQPAAKDPVLIAPVQTPERVVSREGNSTGRERTCETENLSRTTKSTHVHVDDDGWREIDYLSAAPGRCAEAIIAGDVTFDDEERDVVAAGRGARAYFRERVVGRDRALRLVSGPGGTVERTAFVDGRETPYDDAARQWFADFLPEVLREAAIHVPERVAKWRGRGGVVGALREISGIRSSFAKRSHFIALLESRPLEGAELDQITRQAGRELAGSSGDLRAVLEKVPLRGTGATASTRAAIAEAAKQITSDGDKEAVAEALVQFGDKDVLILAAQLVEGMTSDGSKGNVLSAVARSGLADAAVRDAFFRAFSTIVADGTKASVLSDALGDDREVRIRVARAAEHIVSDGDKGRVLREIAKLGLTDSELRAAFLRTQSTLVSDGDRQHVLTYVLDAPGVNEAIVVDVLVAAREITSDGSKGAVLAAVARRRPFAPAVRDAYLKTARTLVADGDQRRALEPLLEP